MKVHTAIDADSTTVVIELRSRDDFERCLKWLPRIEALFPYPPAPPNPEPGQFVPGNVPASLDTQERT